MRATLELCYPPPCARTTDSSRDCAKVGQMTRERVVQKQTTIDVNTRYAKPDAFEYFARINVSQIVIAIDRRRNFIGMIKTRIKTVSRQWNNNESGRKENVL